MTSKQQKILIQKKNIDEDRSSDWLPLINQIYMQIEQYRIGKVEDHIQSEQSAQFSEAYAFFLKQFEQQDEVIEQKEKMNNQKRSARKQFTIDYSTSQINVVEKSESDEDEFDKIYEQTIIEYDMSKSIKNFEISNGKKKRKAIYFMITQLKQQKMNRSYTKSNRFD